MTPQERALVTELFDRLAMLETTRRDPEAEHQIADGLTRAPNATYALVQTVLLQDEALKQADAHIRELEQGAGAVASYGSFLDSMRNQGSNRGSVPSVAPSSKWNISRPSVTPSSAYAAPASAAPPYAQEPARGGSFLGTAAAAAVGVIGGSLLFNGLSNMMGGAHAQSFGAPRDDDGPRSGPWGGDASHGELARDAGADDVGGSASRLSDNGSQSAGLLDGNAPDSDSPFSDSGGGFDSGGFGDAGGGGDA